MHDPGGYSVHTMYAGLKLWCHEQMHVVIVVCPSPSPLDQPDWLGSPRGRVHGCSLHCVLDVAPHHRDPGPLLEVLVWLRGAIGTGHLCCGVSNRSTGPPDNESASVGGAACCLGADLFFVGSASFGGSIWSGANSVLAAFG